MNLMFLYHRHDPMLVLKINPISGFVGNYLCLVLLGYLDDFLHLKTNCLDLRKFTLKEKL